jgi:hypothetical protein
MPRAWKPLARPVRPPDASAVRADGDRLEMWVWEIRIHSDRSRWGVIAYVGPTAVECTKTFASKPDAVAYICTLVTRTETAASGH